LWAFEGLVGVKSWRCWGEKMEGGWWCEDIFDDMVDGAGGGE